MQEHVSFSKARSAKYPEMVQIIMVPDGAGGHNPMTASWVMFTSIEPPMLAISIGHERYSHDLVRSAGEFVVAYPSVEMEQEITEFGSASGRDEDKLAKLGTPIQPGTATGCVLLADAVANFECKVRGELPSGDHTIFVGEIIASHVNTKPVDRMYVLERKRFGGLRPV